MDKERERGKGNWNRDWREGGGTGIGRGGTLIGKKKEQTEFQKGKKGTLAFS